MLAIRYSLLPALLLTAALLSAQNPETAFWPGTRYDPSVPSIPKVLGYEPGERITTPANLIRYLEALAAAEPGRMRVFDYGKTWEGRRLVYAVIGSEKNIARLDEIKAGIQRLSDPRATNAAEAGALIASLPATVWLAYGVHGDEISSSDAALMSAYHLLADQGDAVVDAILANDLVLIDPLQNPDGRARFVEGFEQSEGLKPDADPSSAEHDEPWPGGRTNHYLFDMNRDWFALTQPETRGRIEALKQWFPLVFVDLHEMGGNSTYYFSPEADPYNPFLDKNQVTALDWFGRNNAHWFDQFGFNYFTREEYDAFYPGYGAMWPYFYGGVAMTYEQASTRGLLFRRTDGTVLTYRQTVRQHFVASIATAETAARHRADLLRNFYDYRVSGIADGETGNTREYILPREHDWAAVDRLALLLAEQGIEVRRARTAFAWQGRTIPAGSYIVPLAQPDNRYVHTLLDSQVSMPAGFLKDEERRRRSHLPSEIYDVTAWSLPLLFNVECLASSANGPADTEELKAGTPMPGHITGGEASVAYLVPWDNLAAGRFLTAALQAGVHIHSTDKPFTQNGRRYPSGTLIVKVRENGPDLSALVERLANQSGAEVYATDSGWVDEGVNFGSRYVFSMRAPEVAIAWDHPTSSDEAGNTRFVLERQYGYPVTAIRTAALGRANLSHFGVLILPDSGRGGYAGVLGAPAISHLKEWVQAGGTLIASGPSATAFLADPKTGLLAVSLEEMARPGEEGKKAPAPAASEPRAGAPAALPPARVPGKIFASEADFLKSIQPETPQPDSLRGVIARAKVNPDSWLSDGLPATVNVMVEGSDIFTPIKLDRGRNAAYFAGPDEIFESGYMWEENRKQLAYKPFAMVQPMGRGNVIAFTADPNFRAFSDGLNLMFLNAVFRGPAHSH